jgi:hypothetical protein
LQHWSLFLTRNHAVARRALADSTESQATSRMSDPSSVAQIRMIVDLLE